VIKQHSGNSGGGPLTDSQRLQWLRLLRSENVGAISFWSLMKAFGSAQHALEALPELAERGGKRGIKVALLDDVEREMTEATRSGVRYICANEPEYPELLRHMDGAPPIISVKGNIDCFQKTGLAIVGSRNASAVGLKLAGIFASDLGEAGFIIVSGLARGIDSAAHRASMKTGTIAVMAGGLQHIYPPENRNLYNEIIDNNGLIVSEMAFGWVPRAIDFPRRNRLIAGLALGLLVVEAAHKSGSLISARIANEIGRIVFAIPGSPLDPRAQGTNNLIKSGASLVTEPQDIIETLVPLDTRVNDQQLNFFEPTVDLLEDDQKTMHVEQTTTSVDEKTRNQILNALSLVPIDVETLSYQTDIGLPEIYLALLELDIAGFINRHPGGLISLQPR